MKKFVDKLGCRSYVVFIETETNGVSQMKFTHTTVIHTVTCYADLRSFTTALNDLQNTVNSIDSSAVVYMRSAVSFNDCDELKLKLIEETLTDGSKVYNIEIS